MASDLRGSRSGQRDVSVLHVDDDRSVLDLTAAFLDSELDSVSVATTTNPEEALDRLSGERFDCVISDYDMPGLDGLELFEAIREEHPLVPFVLYTGKGSEEIASRAVNAGVTGYFQKGGPDQQRRLANRIEQAAAEYRTKIEADRYSTVLRALEYPIYVVDETGVFSYVNDPFLEMTGYDRGEIVGSGTDIIKGDEAVATAERKLGEILSSEGPDTAQFGVDIVPKDGDPIPCRDHMGVLPYEGEEFRGSVGILRDISDEKRRETELERRTRAMEKAPIGIVLVDPNREDDPITYVNDRFLGMTGYDREEAIGRNCRFLQGPETRADPVAELRGAIEEGESTTVELRNYRKDGEMFWNQVTISPIRDESGEIDRWIGFQKDVTEYKRRERELGRQNDRLERFAEIVSHDLRSPMSVAEGRIELPKGRIDDGSGELDAALDALGRMETIVEDTLTLARQGHTVGEREVVSLEAAAEASWRTSDTADATLETDADVEIYADGDRLRTLLQNLFMNAARHAGPAATVRLGAIDGGFYVADDGPGIPEEKREAIFEPGHTTAETGTGFGLTIVREIVEAHGWEITVTESEGGGARFDVVGIEKAA
ncbi:PAS domain S-box protein [Natronomonas sp. F2-12]|uniref:histidine kinase n=1 Tax=Natronomonas aquatica TaxID=2841590 RepID=A0A9R1D3B7_9EURY|nr:PAS domain S-box protein [Natronomonas aquatica]MCQ4332159.1 PAS domain S-box protein [Natronomonas aquatica]